MNYPIRHLIPLKTWHAARTIISSFAYAWIYAVLCNIFTRAIHFHCWYVVELPKKKKNLIAHKIVDKHPYHYIYLHIHIFLPLILPQLKMSEMAENGLEQFSLEVAHNIYCCSKWILYILYVGLSEESDGGTAPFIQSQFGIYMHWGDNKKRNRHLYLMSTIEQWDGAENWFYEYRVKLQIETLHLSNAFVAGLSSQRT